MKTRIKQLAGFEPSRRTAIFIAAALAVLRLLALSQQSLTLYPETSMIDDMLTVRAARCILSGEWLGAYNYLTLSKHMLFALWLALIHRLGISYLLAGQLLYTAASGALAQCFAPVIRRRAWRLLFFAGLLFNPASFADFTLRVYRDNITVSFVMLTFAGFIGLALRCTGRKPAALLGWGALGGFALGCSLLLREDGWWLLPAACLPLAAALFLILRRRPARWGARLAALLCPVAVAAACVCAYCGMNYVHYGRFIISDLTSPEFQAAYGAMTRVIPDEADTNPIVPVPPSSLEKLYAVSPHFAALRPYLESEDFTRWQKDCGDGRLSYYGGSLYWAVRSAASLAGYYETPETARQYYLALAQEINDACDSGAFPALGRRSGLNSPVTADRILPTLKESLRSLYVTVTYDRIVDDPELSVGSEQLMDELEAFLHAKAKRTAKTENGGLRIVVWAFGKNGPVDATLLDAQGSPVPAELSLGTGSDIYLDELYAGRDWRYTAVCRKTLRLDMPDEPQALCIQLSGVDGTFTVPAAVSEKSAQGDIFYCVEYVGADYDEQVEHGFVELWLYRLMRVYVLFCRVAGALAFAGAAALCLCALGRCIRRRAVPGQAAAPALLCLLLLAMAALRIGMVSFAEVSAFGIGTYPMYLAAVYPLLISFEFLSVPLFAAVKSGGKGEKP